MASSVAAIVVAAGRGVRVGGEFPKQYKEVAGEPAIRHSLRLFALHPSVGVVQPVIHPDDRALFAQAAQGLELLGPVHGGATRQASVRAASKRSRRTPRKSSSFMTRPGLSRPRPSSLGPSPPSPADLRR